MGKECSEVLRKKCSEVLRKECSEVLRKKCSKVLRKEFSKVLRKEWMLNEQECSSMERQQCWLGSVGREVSWIKYSA